MAELSCAQISRSSGEALTGTASRVAGWLLLQQQGPWGVEALTQSRLDAAFARALAERARQAGVRVLLIRRPGLGATELSRHVYVAHTSGRARYAAGGRVRDLDEVLALDLGKLRRGEPLGFGEPVEQPLYLVCTNGKHDPDCATRGRPLADTLAAAYGDRVWECSHVGGCRFAANLVCFPDGVYYGHVEPSDALRVTARYERGDIDLAHFRGRVPYEPAVQAAEQFLRERERLYGLRDVVPVRRHLLGGGVVAVRLEDRAGHPYDVRVGITRAARARPLTCHADQPAYPPEYHLLDISAG